MNYEQAVSYIDETPKFTTKNSLEHTRECLRRLGNPQDCFKVIHVAGTNGKGSTCAFIASMLREGGYRCGLFTSPHLVKINERFQINEVMVGDEEFLRAFEKVKKLSEELVAEGSYHPTYFEMLFLMGMVIFAQAKVQYVVLETGLGGRMDATNSVAHPLACIITSISMDHMQYLGDTLEKIAGEKAGIIKPGVPVVYDANANIPAAVIAAKAQKEGCTAVAVRGGQNQIISREATGITFSYKEDETVYQIPFIADYQVENASLALACMKMLREEISLSEEQMQKGLVRTCWQGRMETILPGVIVDGAHNEDGVRRFVETAVHFQERYPLTLLFSAVSDKDYQDMIAEICEAITFRKVVTTQVGGEREVSAEELAELFKKQGAAQVSAVPKVQEAYEEAYAAKGKGLLFCVGSLYLVGEIKAHVQ